MLLFPHAPSEVMRHEKERRMDDDDYFDTHYHNGNARIPISRSSSDDYFNDRYYNSFLT